MVSVCDKISSLPLGMNWQWPLMLVWQLGLFWRNWTKTDERFMIICCSFFFLGVVVTNPDNSQSWGQDKSKNGSLFKHLQQCPQRKRSFLAPKKHIMGCQNKALGTLTSQWNAFELMGGDGDGLTCCTTCNFLHVIESMETKFSMCYWFYFLLI